MWRGLNVLYRLLMESEAVRIHEALIFCDGDKRGVG